jgi:hypothetical protein
MSAGPVAADLADVIRLMAEGCYSTGGWIETNTVLEVSL